MRYKNYITQMCYYVGASLLVAVISILINPLLASNLSASDYAIIGYYSSFTILIIPLLHFNLLNYYLRHYYRLSENKKQIMSDTILISILLLGISSLFICLGLFYLYCWYMKISMPFFPYALLVFTQTYLGLFFTFYTTRLRILKKAKSFALITIINGLLNVVFSVLLVVLYKLGADGRLWALLFASLIMAVFSFIKSIGRFQFDSVIFKDAIKFGLPLTISALFWYFYTGIDRVFLEELNDTYQLGIYSVGIQIAAYLMFFYTAIGGAIEPDIYKAIAENNSKKLYILLLGVLGIVCFVNLLFICLTPWVIDLLTAGRYINAAPFARILALQNITMAAFYMVVRLLIGYGYIKTELAIRVIGAIASILLFKFLISNFGFYGAAWGQVLSFLLLSIMGIIFLLFKRNIRDVNR